MCDTKKIIMTETAAALLQGPGMSQISAVLLLTGNAAGQII
jgi:hypothetical protein